MLNDVINNSQRGDGNATLSLINKFNPLLKKYSRKLYYEDAYNDLLIDFLELLHDMRTDSLQDRSDAVTVSYIATSIHNSYVRRLAWIKRSQTTLLYSELSEQELYDIESICSTTDKYSECDFSAFKQLLTASELSVITSIFFRGYTTTETAHLLGISRQAINQAKLRALKKIKILYWDKPKEVRP